MVDKLTVNRRNIKIDVTKGILIILVVIGHLLLGKLNDSIIRYVIYSFHMPIFLFISGYLINIQKLKQENLSDLFRKYFSRLIVPWTIAILVYSLIEYKYDIFEKGFYIFYRPFYHLWYIPAFLSYIFCTYILVKLNVKIKSVLFVLIPITIFLNFIYINPGVNRYFDSNLISNISYLFRPQFYFYFILGIFFKHNFKIINKRNALYLLMLLVLVIFFNVLIFYIGGIVLQNKLITAIIFVLQNTLIGLILVKFLNTGSLSLINVKITSFASWLGKESLGIYLWHVLSILFVKYLFINSPKYYYALSIGSIIILLGIIYLMNKNKFCKQYFLGKI